MAEHDPVAFKEKLKSISFGYGGSRGNGSRDAWHDMDSVASRERAHVAELKAKGVEFERARS